jgi:hypothetical protein
VNIYACDDNVTLCPVHAAAPDMLKVLSITLVTLQAVVTNDSMNIAAKCDIRRIQEVLAKANRVPQ